MSASESGNTIDIIIPDIGDFEAVEVIEILVAVGDEVSEDDGLITLESDKASMEVPAASAGTIQSITVSVGDQVGEGKVIGTMTVAAGTGAETGAAASGGDSATAAPAAASEPSANEPAPATAAESSGSGGNTINVSVPDIGDSNGVEVIEVLVAVGDSVSEEQSLITLESDKASMEVPSPAAGVVMSIAISVGDSVDEGSAVLVLQSEGGKPAAALASTSDKGASNGSPTSGAVAPPDSAATTKAAGGAASPARTASPTAHLDDSKMRKAHASPGIRRYAREHGADLSLVTGTGPKGRILKPDVIAFIKQSMEDLSSGVGASGAGGVQGGMGIPPIPEVDFTKFGEVERVELGRINKLSAANLHRAWLNIPMVTHHDLADVTEMEAFRKQLKNEWKEGQPKITGLAFHMKALVAGLKAFPKFNSSLAPDGQSVFYKKYFHIGIAVDTPNGLVVPVFKDVDKKGINELAEEMADMSVRARNKKLKPGEMQGASMTISSLGGIGGTAFTPIVNPPEVAILGITRASMQPVWNGSEFVPRLMCPLDVSYDHRVIDGAEAARFMAYYVNAVADVRRLLL